MTRLQRNRTAMTTTTEETETNPTVRKRGDSSSRPPRQRSAGYDWDAFDKLKPKNSDYPDNFKPSEDASAPTLFKFLESNPVSVFRLHWIERKGKKSWICTKTVSNPDADCPLCDIGEPARVNVVYNVLRLPYSVNDDGNYEWAKPVVEIWTVTSKRLQDQIKNAAKAPATKPIDRDNLYWTVTRTGEGTSTTYPMQGVKERDLVDPVDEGGWGWTQEQVLTPEQLDEYRDQAWPEEKVVKFNTEAELDEIVAEIS